MPIGSFLGDDDDSAGSTYGLEGTTGQATDVAGGNVGGTAGYAHFCAVVDYTKVCAHHAMWVVEGPFHIRPRDKPARPAARVVRWSR